MSEPPKIDAYEMGRIEIDGCTYTSDVLILPDGVKADWWREEAHALKPGDLTAVLEAAPRFLVVGQGARGRLHVTDEAGAYLKGAEIEVIGHSTAEAVTVYNERRRRGEVVAAALHLTC